MLKIKDDIDLKELEKYGLEPVYTLKNQKTGETEIEAYRSSKYCCRWGYLLFEIGKPSHYKTLNIFKSTRIISDKTNNTYVLKEKDFVDTDLLYDLIKDGLVEKV